MTVSPRLLPGQVDGDEDPWPVTGKLQTSCDGYLVSPCPESDFFISTWLCADMAQISIQDSEWGPKDEQGPSKHPNSTALFWTGLPIFVTYYSCPKHKDPSQMGTNETDFQEPHWIWRNQHFDPRTTSLAYTVVTVLIASTSHSGKPTP